MNRKKAIEIVGCTARFKFHHRETRGEIVGVKEIGHDTSVWFLPEESFEIPGFWNTSDEYPGAFATNIEYLHDITEKEKEFAEDISEESLAEILCV